MWVYDRVVDSPEVLAERVIDALEDVVGREHVVVDAAALERVNTATFDVEPRAVAIVRPADVDEVVAVVRVANELRLQLYPVSGGKNWGLGSRVPTRRGACILDLGRLNRIIAHDEDLSYVTVEPGVTFRQVATYLEERGSDLFLPGIGGSPDASVIGNAVEKGDGLGPLGDRPAACTALEVVLPSGQRLETGLAAFGHAKASPLDRWGLGPDLSGLFLQSNLGVVTRASFWLARRPPVFQGVVFGVKSDDELPGALAGMRRLQALGVVRQHSFALWNIYRFMAVLGRHHEGRELPKPWQGVRWVGMAGLHSASPAHAAADRAELKRALRGHVVNASVIGDRAARFARYASGPLSKLAGVDVEAMVVSMYFESPYLGYLSERNVDVAYWRKREPAPANPDPDRDRCGLHWICVAVPFAATDVACVNDVVERHSAACDLEPNTLFFNTSERYLKGLVVVAYDRDAGGEEERARRCHDGIFAELVAKGYLPNRLGVQSMEAIAPTSEAHSKLLRDLKQQLDPNDVLAPGRYDFRHAWPRET